MSNSFFIVCDYLWLFFDCLWLFWYVNVVCINAGIGQLFFKKYLEKLILFSSINSVRKLQILCFSMKNKEIKNLKNGKKSVPEPLSMYNTDDNCLDTSSCKLFQVKYIPFGMCL